MAPSTGKGKGKLPAKPRATTNSVRATRSTRKSKDVSLPDVYGDMLAEAAVTDPEEVMERPLKRRRVAISSPKVEVDDTASEHETRPVQTAETSGDENSNGSEYEFEDVDIVPPSAGSKIASADEDDDGIADISIPITPSANIKSHSQPRRVPHSAAEKAHRALVHKAHILCLLAHCIYLNSWCNDERVQSNLRAHSELLPNRTRTYLHPKADATQLVQNRSFLSGLEQACDAFKGAFEVTANGMRMPVEGEADPSSTNPVDREDFIAASKSLTGSQDTGNQLFCALLRSAGVEARLVCSLQVLPLSAAKKGTTPVKQKERKPHVLAIAPDYDTHASVSDASDTSITSRKIPSARRRLGQPSFAMSPAAAGAPSRSRFATPALKKLAYPVFWVEAFNPSYQTWHPLDPLHTGSTNKPSLLEPPLAYHALNTLVYVFAFESSGTAYDVTRRYTRAYAAKTRRLRIDAHPSHSDWWNRVTAFFQPRGHLSDRDTLERAALAQREGREGMPSNVADFKGHPNYALERHLKRNEVLLPRREVGKMNAGTAARPRMEGVFRRGDVKVVRSADKWYRLGRVLKAGEQAVKTVPAARGVRRKEEGEDVDEKGLMTDLYAEAQTELYVPAPVVDGVIPRNAFGNLDIYVPSMVPAGGVHIRHPLLRQAARVLGIDCVDAVVGFTFKGRAGTAVIEGGVVEERYMEAIEAAVEGVEAMRREEESKGRSARALGAWARIVRVLRVRERVEGLYGGGATVEEEDEEAVEREEGVVEKVGELDAFPTAGMYSLAQLLAPTVRTRGEKREKDGDAPRRSGRKRVAEAEEESELDDGDEYDEDAAGGFLPDADEAPRSLRPRQAVRRVIEEDEDDGDDGGGGFMLNGAEDENVSGGFLPDLDDGEGTAGGFFAEEDNGEDASGGFLPDDGEEDRVLSNHSNDGVSGTADPIVQLEEEGKGAGREDEASDGAAGDSPAHTKSEEDKASEHHLLDVPNDAFDSVHISGEAMALMAMPATSLRPSPSGAADAQQHSANNDDRFQQTARPLKPDDDDEAPDTDTALEGTIPGPLSQKSIEATTQDQGNADGPEVERERRTTREASILSHDPEDDDAEPDWMVEESD